MIVYFHCTDLPDWPEEAGAELTAGLLASGRPVRLCGDLARLSATGDSTLADVAAEPELRIVSPFYARAVRWLFHAGGSELPTETPCTVTQGRNVDDILSELLGGAVEITDEHRRQARQQFDGLAAGEDDWRPWFPVIDYDRCTACGQCAAFCLFGVYTHEPQRVRVTRPVNCKNNCPACARVCPAGAIIFPKHNAAPINANDDAPAEPDVLPGFGDLRDPDVMEKLRARASAARAAAEQRRRHMEDA
jgi:ferredoxin